MFRLFCLFALGTSCAQAYLFSSGSSPNYSTEKLGQYNVDKSAISVSGISAGGAMAVQFHVAFSSDIMGMGSIAGIPYHCSGGNLGSALGTCMSTPSGINVGNLESIARSRARSGKIDAVENLNGDPVFIWAGSSDTTVKKEASDKMEEFYHSFQSNTRKVIQSGAAHTFPTLNYGTYCTISTSPYIGKCNYDGAFELLNHIYGNLVRPTGSVDTSRGKFLQFDQKEFLSGSRRRRFDPSEYVNSVLQGTLGGGSSTGSGSTSGSNCNWFNPLTWMSCLPGGGSLPGMGGSLPGMGGSLPGMGGSLPGLGGSGGQHSMDDVGFAYVPSGCLDKSKACKLHVSFHGCQQGKEKIGDVYAKHTGYNEVAELNDIIILYPQIVSNMIGNPNGCWDWWGYDHAEFDTKNGPQMKAVKQMIDRATG